MTLVDINERLGAFCKKYNLPTSPLAPLSLVLVLGHQEFRDIINIKSSDGKRDGISLIESMGIGIEISPEPNFFEIKQKIIS